MQSTKEESLWIRLIAGERKGVLAEAIYCISQRFGFPKETEELGVPSTVHRMVSQQGMI